MVTALLWLIAVLAGANGAWMLAVPGHWFHNIPADVPALGPLNEHFVRDIGCAYLAAGVALIWGAMRPVHQRPLVAVAAVFFVAHALIHLTGTSGGAIPVSHWLIDLPSVYLPAVILTVIAALPGSRPSPG